MSCEVEQSYGPVNFIENATKLHIRALESWKRGIHTLNERLISMQIERDTLREQLEAMHAGYKKQLQLKVMKINELQNTITDITKKLNANSSDRVKEEDADSNDMENSTSMHEEGYDDPYTSDDQSPDLSHGEYGDVYLDAGTDEDTPTVLKQRQSTRSEDSRGIEASCSMGDDAHRTERSVEEPRFKDSQDGRGKEDNCPSVEGSGEQKEGNGRPTSVEGAEARNTLLTQNRDNALMQGTMSEEPVVVTVLPEDNGRSDYLETQGLEDVEASDEQGNDENTAAVDMSNNTDDKARHEDGRMPEERESMVTSVYQHHGNRLPEQVHGPPEQRNAAMEEFNKGMIFAKSGGQMNMPPGHTIKRSVSESEIPSEQSFKLPKLQPTTYMLGRSCMPLKGPGRKHMISRPNSYGYAQMPKNSGRYDSSFVPTMSNVSFHDNSPVDNGIPSYPVRGSQYGNGPPNQVMKTESKPGGANAGSISQLASFYQKEFDISKQYKCDFCGSKYTKLASLRRHLRAHTGIKPYKCMSCFKEFTRRDVLKIHMERHKVQNQYSCYICGLKFAYVKDLREHGLNQHKEYMSVFKESLPGGDKD